MGVDVGLESYITLSTGEKVGNPRFLASTYKRLRSEQKALSRKEKGSNNWERQKKRVAKAYAKVADRRADFLHKLSTRLVESLRRDHRRNAGGEEYAEEPFAGEGDQRCVSWSEFVRQLEYKCEWYGKTLVKVDAGSRPQSVVAIAVTSEKVNPCTSGNGRAPNAAASTTET